MSGEEKRGEGRRREECTAGGGKRPKKEVETRSEKEEKGEEREERGTVLIHAARILKSTRITNHRPMLIVDNVCTVSNIVSAKFLRRFVVMSIAGLPSSACLRRLGSSTVSFCSVIN